MVSERSVKEMFTVRRSCYWLVLRRVSRTGRGINLGRAGDRERPQKGTQRDL